MAKTSPQRLFKSEAVGFAQVLVIIDDWTATACLLACLLAGWLLLAAVAAAAAAAVTM